MQNACEKQNTVLSAYSYAGSFVRSFTFSWRRFTTF